MRVIHAAYIGQKHDEFIAPQSRKCVGRAQLGFTTMAIDQLSHAIEQQHAIGSPSQPVIEGHLRELFVSLLNL